MEKESKKENKLTKKFWLLVLGICVALIVIIFTGFFFFSNRDREVVSKTKKGGNLTLNYVNDVNGLSLINAVAVTDDVGMKNLTDGQYFDFSVDVDLDNASEVEYEISITKEDKYSTINDKDIKIYLEKEKSGTYTKVFGPEAFTELERETKLGSEEGSMVLVKAKKTSSSIDNYRLRMWLDSKSVVSNGNYSVEVNVNGKAK